MNLSTERERAIGNAKVNISRLPFSAIPGQSRLFLDYLRSPQSLIAYYPNAVESVDELAAFVPHVLANYRTDRDQLCNALIEINAAAGAGTATIENIELLRESDTVAVLTGQQAGLFTGPLYTIYKALSAIKLAETLRTSGIKAVPIFWAATEDHDFDEVSESWFVDSSGALDQTEYRPVGYIEDTPVGSVQLDPDISSVIDRLINSLPKTEFSHEVQEVLTDAWHPGVGFGNAFMRTVMLLLGKFGLVIVDPLNDKIKQLASPMFVEGIQKADRITEAVVARSKKLISDGYHSQVLVEDNYFPLFWIDDQGKRLALRKIGEGIYRVKGGKKEFSVTELEKTAREEPNRFSPGVMLRPVVQDHLFPTVCYFGGGAEIAYFAQNSVVYELLDRPVTPILHRQSFTVVEPRQRRALEKLRLSLTDLFGGRETVRLQTAGSTVGLVMSRLFADIEERINGELNRLDQELSQFDPTIAANLAQRRRKIIYHIGALKKKTILAKARQDETFRQRVDGLFSSLLPNDGLQERSLNAFSFINNYGLNFIDWIYDAVDLNDKDHRIIEL